MAEGDGWYPDIDDSMPNFKWQPCVQVDGLTLSLDVWYRTEDECHQFIAELIQVKEGER